MVSIKAEVELIDYASLINIQLKGIISAEPKADPVDSIGEVVMHDLHHDGKDANTYLVHIVGSVIYFS